MVQEPKFWYRYDTRWTGEVLDTCLWLQQFEVIKETPKGAWLDVYGEKRFINREWRKRYACPTADEAMTGYIKRKEAEIRILKRRLAASNAGLALAQAGLTEHPARQRLFQVPEGDFTFAS